MIRPILEWPNQMLTGSRSLPTGPSEALDKLIDDMFDTMREAGGIGLAAIQVGVPIRLFVLHVGGVPEAFLNPSWQPWKGSKPVPMDEGCLSVRQPVESLVPTLGKYYRATVPRYERINIQYMSRGGSIVKGSLRGLRAQAFQHEHEHLEGRIFLDHLPQGERAELFELLTEKG